MLHAGLPSNCYADNAAPAGSAPADLEQVQPTCGVPTTATNSTPRCWPRSSATPASPLPGRRRATRPRTGVQPGAVPAGPADHAQPVRRRAVEPLVPVGRPAARRRDGRRDRPVEAVGGISPIRRSGLSRHDAPASRASRVSQRAASAARWVTTSTLRPDDAAAWSTPSISRVGQLRDRVRSWARRGRGPDPERAGRGPRRGVGVPRPRARLPPRRPACRGRAAASPPTRPGGRSRARRRCSSSLASGRPRMRFDRKVPANSWACWSASAHAARASAWARRLTSVPPRRGRPPRAASSAAGR